MVHGLMLYGQIANLAMISKVERMAKATGLFKTAAVEREAFVHAIQHAGKALISTVSVVEARMVVHGRRG